jgi:hypothetical protein
MAQHLYHSLACGKSSICPPTKIQRLQMISEELKVLPRGPNNIPRVKALQYEVQQLMKSATVQERSLLGPTFHTLRGFFSDILQDVVGTVTDTIQDVLSGGEENGEECWWEDGEEWCNY